MRRAPVTCNVTFGKADIARAQGGTANLPVVQVQAGHGRTARAESLYAPAGQLQSERTVLQAGQQFHGAARSGGCVGGQRLRLAGLAG